LSYQVLARKWRPRDFGALVGQNHVVRALTNGLDQGRLHHAFLFTGTRGVGKTTIARILAKALNCLEGVSASPCGDCEHCVAIDQGRFVDLLEIDAASRTRVDDTREILDNVQYAPARGRFKVYLIDEVHMLSTHSFNALLKTLEEPPEHVKFVLATTDPQKIPVTILSRCMQFNLRRLGPDEIAGQMQAILDAEGVDYDQGAVSLLARAADGSMRDGLSLLDQALAAGSGALRREPVEDMLGTVEQRHLEAILDALAEADPGAALAAVDAVHELARDMARLLGELAEALHRIALIQQVPEYRDTGRADWPRLSEFAGRLDPEDVQLYYQISVTGQRDLALAPSERSGCEMTLLRMFAFRPAASGTQARPANAGDGAGRRPAADAQPHTKSHAQSAIREPPPAAPPACPSSSASEQLGVAPVAASAAASDGIPSPENWPTVLAALDLNSPVRAVAGNLALVRADERELEFRIDRDDLGLATERFRRSLGQAIEAYTGEARRLVLTPVDDAAGLDTPARRESERRGRQQQSAEAAIAADPVVRRLQETFDAELVAGSVRPISDENQENSR